MRTVLLLLLTILLPSCAATGPAVDCQAWRPIAIDEEADVVTRETARQILAHNLTGRRLCGW
ncbi:hypothetical protein [Roseococcus thiosulfatophilus]|uniref:hypothetical protein n=1 Tax=Roseococcus thiosulfatophilus TaxID=35813 RepID=UPI001A8E67E8|nr:hypothetical protein [Roseococcus thiosulfatophilus]